MGLKKCAICGAILLGHIVAAETLESCCGSHDALPSPQVEIRARTYRRPVEAVLLDFSHVPEERAPNWTEYSQIFQAATSSSGIAYTLPLDSGSVRTMGRPVRRSFYYADHGSDVPVIWAAVEAEKRRAT